MITRRQFLARRRRAPRRFRPASCARGRRAGRQRDTEIKIGQTMPYSGPASAYGVIGRAEAAYFKMINEQGGVNGRKINLISLDDGYSPPKTVEQTRRLVEQEQVAFMFNTLGTPLLPRGARLSATRTRCRNCSSRPAPATFTDPEHFPGRSAFNPIIRPKRSIYAKHILKTKPDAKIGVLLPERRFRQGLSSSASRTGSATMRGMIVKEAVLRNHRADRRFAGDVAAGRGRRRVRDRRDAEIRRAGDPQESTISAGTRRATSPTSRCRSARS